jgi:Uncharacterised protein family (UPF0160)
VLTVRCEHASALISNTASRVHSEDFAHALSVRVPKRCQCKHVHRAMPDPMYTCAHDAGYMAKPVHNPDVRKIWLQVYKNFIEAIDAVDNGVNQFKDAGEPLYLENTSLAKRVGSLNPKWNEPAGNAAIDARFADAVALTGREFEDAVRHAVNSWLPARSIVAAALNAAPSVHSSGTPDMLALNMIDAGRRYPESSCKHRS